MSRPPPPPSATHSSFNCPNSSPADNISTAADVDAVAAEARKKKAEEMLARRQISLQIKKAWLSSCRTAKDDRCVVMDFSQNGDVSGLKEQPAGPTSTYYYYTSTYYYYPSGNSKNCSDIAF